MRLVLVDIVDGEAPLVNSLPATTPTSSVTELQLTPSITGTSLVP